MAEPPPALMTMRAAPNDVGGLLERVGVARRYRRNRETFRQGFKIEVLDDLGLMLIGGHRKNGPAK